MATEKAEESATNESTATDIETTEKVDSALTASEAEGTDTSLTQSAAPELPDKWMAALDSDLKSDKDAVKLLENFKRGLPDIAKAYVELKRKPEGLRIPDATATTEEMAAFRKAIGVPENPTDYKLEKPDLPEDLEIDPQWDEELRKKAHELNMTQGQTEELRQWYFKRFVSDMKPVKTTMEEANKLLRKEWGTDYEVAQAYKARAVKKFLTPELSVLFGKTGIGNHPAVLKMFKAIGQAMSDHFFAEGSRGERPEAAAFGQRSQSQIADILYTPKK